MTPPNQTVRQAVAFVAYTSPSGYVHDGDHVVSGYDGTPALAIDNETAGGIEARVGRVVATGLIDNDVARWLDLGFVGRAADALTLRVLSALGITPQTPSRPLPASDPAPLSHGVSAESGVSDDTVGGSMKPCTCPTCTEPLVITCANRCANAADGATVTSFGYQKHLRAVHDVPVREERPVVRPAVEYPRQRAKQVPRELSRQRVMALLGDTSVVTAQMLVTRFGYTIGTAYNILSDLVAEGALERNGPGRYQAKSEVLA